MRVVTERFDLFWLIACSGRVREGSGEGSGHFRADGSVVLQDLAGPHWQGKLLDGLGFVVACVAFVLLRRIYRNSRGRTLGDNELLRAVEIPNLCETAAS